MTIAPRAYPAFLIPLLRRTPLPIIRCFRQLYHPNQNIQSCPFRERESNEANCLFYRRHFQVATRKRATTFFMNVSVLYCATSRHRVTEFIFRLNLKKSRKPFLLFQGVNCQRREPHLAPTTFSGTDEQDKTRLTIPV